MEVDLSGLDTILSDDVLEALRREARESCVLCELDDIGEDD